MLSETAREAGVWLIGGSIPECRAGESKIWNTATVWDPAGAISASGLPRYDDVGELTSERVPVFRLLAGNLVAKHRKVHLYDCDFPGGVYFKVRKQFQQGAHHQGLF